MIFIYLGIFIIISFSLILLKISNEAKLVRYIREMMDAEEYEIVKVKSFYVTYYIKIVQETTFKRNYVLYRVNKKGTDVEEYSSNSPTLLNFYLASKLSFSIIFFTINKEDYVNY